MPVLGDTPITSYFTRSSSTSKRKGKDTTSESSTKRRKQADSPSGKASTSKGKERDIQTLLTGKTETDAVDSSSPQTPLPATSRSKGKAVAPPTPPTTGVAPSKGRKAAKELRISPYTPSPFYVSRPDTAVAPLPTPSTVQRPIDKPHAARPKLTRAELEPPLPSSSSVTPLRNIELDLGKTSLHRMEPMLDSVPSSQSQDVPDISIPPVQHVRPALRDTHSMDHDCGGFEDEDQVVISSQSQPILFVASPKAMGKEIRPEPTETCLEVVPSSQSQERELTIPLGPSENGAKETVPQHPSHRRSTEQPAMPQRTLSDKLFSVPIQDSVLEGIFPDHAISDHAAYDNLVADESLMLTNTQGSITESEEEDEAQERLNITHKHGRVENAISSCSRVHQSQERPDSQDSFPLESYSSLPPAVTDFREMFGHGDESYPVDFPESLRS